MRTRTWIAGVIAALPLLIGAAVPLIGGSPKAQPAPETQPDPTRSDWPNQERLNQAAQAADDLGAKHPDVYAGVEMELPTDVLIVHRVRGIADTAAFDQAVHDRVRAVAAPSRVVIENALYTQAQLHAWAATLRGDDDYWKGRGVEGYSVGSPPGGNCVKVGLTDPARDGDIFRNHYTFPICLEAGGSDVLFAGP